MTSKSMKIYHDKDADLGVLKNKKIAVIGYGSQGNAQADMMRDSGLKIIVGVRENGPSWKKALEVGHTVMNVSDASKEADIIHILIPDEIQSDVYKKHIARHVEKGKTLSCSHGFNFTFKQITPPKEVDVIMVAPKAPGPVERRLYLEGFGAPALIAVQQNPSGEAKKIALAMAKAMGFTRAGVIETTMYEEATSDLFGEQAVLCGGVVELMKAGFYTLIEAGYAPELAYFECINELKLILDLIYEGGIEHMWSKVSNTAEYGGRTRGKLLITDETKRTMKRMLMAIRSGKFAQEWMNEARSGMPKLKELRQQESKEQVEEVGKQIRKLFEKKTKP